MRMPKNKQKAIVLVLASIMVITILLAFAIHTKKNTPPTDLSGCIIVFYRNSCPDCKATMKEIRTAFNGTSDVYFVNSRSETGKEIRESYPISEVPSAVYIHKSDDNYTMYVLYEKTKDGPKTDFGAIDRIINLKQNSR